MSVRPFTWLVLGALTILTAPSVNAAGPDCWPKRPRPAEIDLLFNTPVPVNSGKNAALRPTPPPGSSKSEYKAFEKAIKKLTKEEVSLLVKAEETYMMSLWVQDHILHYNTWREGDGDLMGIPITLDEILAAHDCTRQKLESDYEKMSAQQPLSDFLWQHLQRSVWRTYFLMRCVRDDAELFPELHEQLDARIQPLEAFAHKVENSRPAAPP